MSRFSRYIETLSHEEKELLFHELRESLKVNDNEKINMEKIAESVRKVTGIRILNFKTRLSKQVTARVILCRALQRVGYTNKEIMSFLGLSKGAIQHYEGVFRDWMSNPWYVEEEKMWNQLKKEIKLCD